MSWGKAAPDVYRSLLHVHKYLEGCGLEKALLDLIYLRASQINGCAYCIDMHWKDLRAEDVPEQKLYMLNAWREWNGYSEREQAALEWTEAVTKLTNAEVPDDVYERARAQFDEAELAKLTLAVATINSWNRMNIAFRREAGDYKPAHTAAASA